MPRGAHRSALHQVCLGRVLLVFSCSRRCEAGASSHDSQVAPKGGARIYIYIHTYMVLVLLGLFVQKCCLLLHFE